MKILKFFHLRQNLVLDAERAVYPFIALDHGVRFKGAYAFSTLKNIYPQLYKYQIIKKI